MEQPGEHLQGGGFPGAVWAEKADDLTGRDVEGDAPDRGDLTRTSPDQTLHRGFQPLLSLWDLEGLRETPHLTAISDTGPDCKRETLSLRRDFWPAVRALEWG